MLYKYVQKIKAIYEDTTKEMFTFKSTNDILEFLNKYELLGYLAEENLFIICLDTRNHVTAYSQVSKGGIASTNVDVKTVFKVALLSNAEKLIVTHNHPSGSLKASREDIELTRAIKKDCNLLGFELLDSIIVAKNDVISFIKEID